ncbi:hypothetical protein D3C86_1354540 [compost metagenome]
MVSAAVTANLAPKELIPASPDVIVEKFAPPSVERSIIIGLPDAEDRPTANTVDGFAGLNIISYMPPGVLDPEARDQVAPLLSL